MTNQKNKLHLRIDAFILCLFMVLTIVPFSALAGEPEATQGEYKISVSGGTAAFVGKSDTFSGTADENDIIKITYTESAGRTFKYWQTETGVTIKDKTFSVLVNRDIYVYAVYTDTFSSPFGDWVLVSSGNCIEGNLYKSENSLGDVRYKVEYPTYGRHQYDYSNAEPVDASTHLIPCRNCTETLVENHYILSEVTKEATHAEAGETTFTCSTCGYSYTTPIDKLDGPHEMSGEYYIFQKSVNGEYGIRSEKCKYCDYTESSWYLDYSLESLFKNNYIKAINRSSMYGTKSAEYFYSFTEADGTVAYFYMIQYFGNFGNTKDNNATYLFRFYDDGNPEKIKPIYMTATGTNAYVEDAVYGYVYDFNGWINELDSISYYAGYKSNGEICVVGNSMDERSSILAGISDSWARQFNAYKIPITENPEEWLSAHTSLEFRSSRIANQSKIVDETWVYYGGLEVTMITSPVSTSSGTLTEYKAVIPGTGATVKTYDPVAGNGTSWGITEFKPIISTEDYAALDDDDKRAYMSVDSITSDIKNVSKSRYMIDTTLEEPETVGGFRVCVPVGSDFYSISCPGGNSTSYYTNPARCFTSGREITMSYEAKDGYEFVRWDKWNFEEQKWETYTTAESFSFNTSANPNYAAAYFKVVTKETPITYYTVTVADGLYFNIGDDYSTRYTEASVPADSTVRVYSSNVPVGKYLDKLLINSVTESENYSFVISEDTTFSPIYKDSNYEVQFAAYNDVGTVKLLPDGTPSTSVIGSGTIGSNIKVTTAQPSSSGDFGTFLGWYEEEFTKEGSKYTLLSTSTTLTYTITADSCNTIYAVWTDGSISMEPKTIDIEVVGGFFYEYNGGSEAAPYIISAGSVSSYTEITMVEMPNASTRVAYWSLTYDLSSGPYEEWAETNFGEENEAATHYFMSADTYKTKVTITAVAATPCAASHSYNEGRITIEPTHTAVGEKTITCTRCGDSYTEEVAKLEEHTFGNWTSISDTEHRRSCACGETETAAHRFGDGIVIEAEHLTRYTCSICNGVKNVPDEVPGLNLKEDAPANIEIVGEVPYLNDVNANTSVVSIKGMFENTNLTILDKNGSELADSANIGTGSKIQLKDAAGNLIDEVTVIVPGDTDGDGQISAVDALIALKQSVGLITIDSPFEIAGDVSGTGAITSLDALNILRVSAGLEPIAPQD